MVAGNNPPVISSDPAATPNPVKYGEIVTFSVAASDPDGDTLTYSWDFGDSATSSEQNPTHVFAAPGTYDVTVTVSDDKGGTAVGTVTVEVIADSITLSKLQIKREFEGERRLKIKAKGIVEVPAGISPEGVGVELNIAGVVVSGAMDYKGKIALDNLKFKLAPKWEKQPDGSRLSIAGPAKFSASILENDADWASELDGAELVQNVPEPDPVDLPFSLTVGAKYYAAECSGLWKSKDVKGAFKGPVD